MPGVRRRSRFLAVLAALAVAAAALSCGGGPERESVTGPASFTAAPASDGGGSVTASQADKQSVCHHDAVLDTFTTLSLTAQAVAAHLKSHTGDNRGACASCPCFTAADLAQDCGGSGPPNTACPSLPEYGLLATCPSPSNPNLGTKSVNPDAKSCFKEDWDDFTGEPADVVVTDLTDAQVADCKRLIVNSPYYPASCPE